MSFIDDANKEFEEYLEYKMSVPDTDSNDTCYEENELSEEEIEAGADIGIFPEDFSDAEEFREALAEEYDSEDDDNGI